MSIRFHVVKRVEYDDTVMRYLSINDNPIANNLSCYISETPQYYLSIEDFNNFKEETLKDIEQLDDEEEKQSQLEILSRMEKRVNEDLEIILESW